MTDEADIDAERPRREPFWVRRRRVAEAAAVSDRAATVSGNQRLSATVDRTRASRDRPD
jgi:hypothetical protein